MYCSPCNVVCVHENEWLRASSWAVYICVYNIDICIHPAAAGRTRKCKHATQIFMENSCGKERVCSPSYTLNFLMARLHFFVITAACIHIYILQPLQRCLHASKGACSRFLMITESFGGVQVYCRQIIQQMHTWRSMGCTFMYVYKIAHKIYIHVWNCPWDVHICTCTYLHMCTHMHLTRSRCCFVVTAGVALWSLRVHTWMCQ